MIDMKSILNQSIGIKFMCIVALSNKASLVIGQAAVTFEAISINKRFGVEYVCVRECISWMILRVFYLYTWKRIKLCAYDHIKWKKLNLSRVCSVALQSIFSDLTVNIHCMEEVTKKTLISYNISVEIIFLIFLSEFCWKIRKNSHEISEKSHSSSIDRNKTGSFPIRRTPKPTKISRTTQIQKFG